jgi:DNA-3-methyladenine glycosylase
MTQNLSLSEALNVPVEEAARRLLGAIIERTVDGAVLRAKIVEVEAYDQTDPASHTFRGPSVRNASMFKAAGHAYVYFIYGMHYCLNIVAGASDYGAGVLIRAVEPLDGEAIMIANRSGRTGIELSNGPSKLCEALAIDRTLDGHDVAQSPLRVLLSPPLADDQVVVTGRIGITKAADWPRRFYLRDSPYVSKP